MKDFYRAFYLAIEHSRAHSRFCARVFGADLGQHGFADVAQLDLLRRVTGMHAGQRALDLGCGNGAIAQHLFEQSRARFTGIDHIEAAVAAAQRRAAARPAGPAFACADIGRVPFRPSTFDLVLSIDTAYFADNLLEAVGGWQRLLRPQGRLAIFYSYGREPWVPVELFPKDSLPARKTPLGQALERNGLDFRFWDLTAEDYRLAQLRKQVLADLEHDFASEGNRFIFENRLGDACGVSEAVEAGLHARYLYVTEPIGPPAS